MRIRTARLNLRLVTGLAAVLGLALTFASLPTAAQQWTPKQANSLAAGRMYMEGELRESEERRRRRAIIARIAAVVVVLMGIVAWMMLA